MRKVAVSGCFDLLHAGHVAFLETAARHGELHLFIGSDENIERLKGSPPTFRAGERVYLLSRLRFVHSVAVASGRGLLDFAPDIERLRPDLFIVNRDGHDAAKEDLCRRLGIEYLVLERRPPPGLPARSSSAIKRERQIPYRLALAGGWIDQPWVSSLAAGSMVVVAIEPTHPFNDRSGLATSTRRAARELWGDCIPEIDLERTARTLFAVENPPGTRYVSGSQDAIGLVYPGTTRLDYDGRYWPSRISSCCDEVTLRWLESVLWLIEVAPRPVDYDPLESKNLDPKWIERLGQSGVVCWQAIQDHDVGRLGQSLNQTVACWERILPRTVLPATRDSLRRAQRMGGATFSGCGGGYLIIAADKAPAGAIPIRVRRPR